MIAHEVTHAALAIYEQDVLNDQRPVDIGRDRYPWDSMENEEILCHLVGELMAKVVNGLYAHGCYDGKTRMVKGQNRRHQ